MNYYIMKFKSSLNIYAVIITIIVYLTLPLSITNPNDNIFLLLIMMLGWFSLHELIHAVGFLLFGKANKKNIVFGAVLEEGIFYCACKEKISKKGILFSVLLPFIIIGIITLILGLLFKNNVLILLSILNIIGSIFDITMAIDILSMPKDIIYQDLDDPTGFMIISKSEINKKFISLKTIEKGKYDEKIKPKKFKRIYISKKSIIIIFILLMITIIVS